MVDLFEFDHTASQDQPSVEHLIAEESVSINWLSDSIEADPVASTVAVAGLCLGAVAAVVVGRRKSQSR